MVEFIGLTGPIKFDTSGLRTQFELDLMELQVTGLERVGTWNSLDHLEAGRKQEDICGTFVPALNIVGDACVNHFSDMRLYLRRAGADRDEW